MIQLNCGEIFMIARNEKRLVLRMASHVEVTPQLFKSILRLYGYLNNKRSASTSPFTHNLKTM